jgi:hypothetical protein
MGMIAWILLGLGAGLLAAILLLAYHLATGPTTRTGRHRHSYRSYDSGMPALVRAEKRLHQAWQPPADQRRWQDEPPL